MVEEAEVRANAVIDDAIVLYGALTAERVAMFDLFKAWFNLASRSGDPR